MSDNEDSWDENTWDELLDHIEQQMLIPVVGPDVTVVSVDDAEQTFTTLIGQRLAQKLQLTLPPGMTTMDDAVGAFLRERGRLEVERLYGAINRIITQLDPAPGQALRDLAAITDLRLFVSTTPDRVLAKALNKERFPGRPLVRELEYSPTLSTSKQLPAQVLTDTDTVLNLFGKAAPTPQFAIHEEDQLEWLLALVSDEASDPGWLAHQLKRQPMLFIGCEIPDWSARFLVRMSSNTRLWLDDKHFFFVGSPSNEPSLATFFATFCRKAQVKRLEMAPTEFVAELRKRWEAQRPPRPSDRDDSKGLAPRLAPEIFISYMREDAVAARRLRDAISGLGGVVWMDEGQISPGDTWEGEISTAIRHTRLFVPIISANTVRVKEGFAFKEWKLAIDRASRINGRRFIVPVVVDEDYEGDPSRFGNLPEDFLRFDFGQAPAGDPDAELINMLTGEIRAMRSAPAA